MDFNNMANFINEGIRSGFCDGKELVFIAATATMIQQKIKNINKIGECGLERKDCKSKPKFSCLKANRNCKNELLR